MPVPKKVKQQPHKRTNDVQQDGGLPAGLRGEWQETNLSAQLLDSVSDAVFLYDLEGNVVYANERAYQSLGYSKREFFKTKLRQLVAPEHVPAIPTQFKLLMEKGEIIFESAFLRKDRTIMPVEAHACVQEMGGKKFVLGVIRDITERKKMEEELKLRAELLDSTTDSIFVHDFEGNFIYVNNTACQTHGYNRDEFLKLKLQDIVAHSHLESDFQQMLEKGQSVFESVHRRRDGSIMPVEVHGRTIELAEKKVLLTVIRDITERKKLEERIKQIAYHDTLTGLPNRALFNDRFNLALAHASRYEHKLALMMMDLDRFKEVNDTLGHDVGDWLLRKVSGRLGSITRKTDTMSRMGGDEFVLLVTEVGRDDDVMNVAQKLVEAFQEPFVFDGHQLSVTTSIGIALYPDDGKDVDTLLKHADFAMYQVKRKGRNGYLRYTPNMKPRG